MTEEEFNAERKPKNSFLHDVHRLLPSSCDSEQGVLCSILLAPREVLALCDEKGITPAHYHIPAHSEIYRVITKMRPGGSAIDVITLTQELRNRKMLDQVGGPAFITDLFTFLPTFANASYYIEILEEKYTLREIIRVCTEYAARSYDEQGEVTMLLDELEAKVLRISRDRYKLATSGCSARDLALIGIAEIERRINLGAQISGLSTGFRTLDEKTDGLHGQEFIALAGKSGTGKSALAMQIIDHLAIEQRIPCAVWPLEAGRKQLIQRMIYTRAKVNPIPWRFGVPPSDAERARMVAATVAISEAPIYFEDAPDCTIQSIRAQARRLVDKHGVRFFLIDSLSAMSSNTRQGRDNRIREAAECSQGCKDMAKELNATVLLICHIGRDILRSERPNPSHLRESGKVEIDADALWFAYEPDFDEANQKSGPEPEIRIWIPKQRDCDPFVEASLTFVKRFTRFQEGESEPEPEAQLGMNL